ncbi:MAG: ComEA family DNA-binding protein [Gammaproteobacteria bacterium]|nr:ComEA family DNA-binding protein [Gammaproteobacteria bacterium]
MHRFLTIVAVAVMLLPAPAALAAPADEPEASETASGDLSADALKVNINTDDAAAIAAGLNGIGLKRAQAIVQYREANGPFRNAGELADVKGIGARTVAVNSDRIAVD